MGMGDVSVVGTLNPSIANSVKPPAAPSPATNSVRNDSRGNQTARVSEEGLGNPTSASPPQKDVSLAKANAAGEDINHQLAVAQHTLRFQIDNSTDEIKVQVVETETGKVVGPLPPEPSLGLLANGDFSGLFSVQG